MAKIYYDGSKVITGVLRSFKRLGYVSSHSISLQRAFGDPGDGDFNQNVWSAANFLKGNYKQLGLKKFNVKPKGWREFTAYAAAKSDLPAYLNALSA